MKPLESSRVNLGGITETIGHSTFWQTYLLLSHLRVLCVALNILLSLSLSPQEKYFRNASEVQEEEERSGKEVATCMSGDGDIESREKEKLY